MSEKEQTAQEPDAQVADAQAPAETAPPATAPKPEETPPWGDDFDPARAWKTIQTLREKEKRLQDFERAQREREDAEKTEAQRLADRLAEAESAAKSARTDLLRERALRSFAIPEDLAGFLTGDTEEEIQAKAEALAKYAGAKAPGAEVPGKPKPRLVPGSGAPDSASADPEDPAALAAKIRASLY